MPKPINKEAIKVTWRLRRRGYSHAQVVQALNGMGVNVVRDTVRKHYANKRWLEEHELLYLTEPDDDELTTGDVIEEIYHGILQMHLDTYKHLFARGNRGLANLYSDFAALDTAAISLVFQALGVSDQEHLAARIRAAEAILQGSRPAYEEDLHE